MANDDILKNIPMPGSASDEAWPWDAIISIVDSDDETAESVGTSIASTFTASAKELFGKKQEFIYRAATDDEKSAPIIKYILDEDVIETFKIMYGADNTKEELLSADKLLEVFFGTTENAKRLLEYEYF